MSDKLITDATVRRSVDSRQVPVSRQPELRGDFAASNASCVLVPSQSNGLSVIWLLEGL